MPRFKMNQDMTYGESALVKKNRFLSMVADESSLPKYEDIAYLPPQP